jgi:hypothetical protein
MKGSELSPAARRDFEERVLSELLRLLAPESPLAIERYSRRGFRRAELRGSYPETSTVVIYVDDSDTEHEELFDVWADVANPRDPEEPRQVAMLAATNAAGL